MRISTARRSNSLSSF